MKDYLDTDFLKGDAVAGLKELASLGHEVASHSMSHSPSFATFPMGDGTEAYPTYRPSVHDKSLTLGGTILGELRVSKYLIESIVPQVPVVSFRPWGRACGP